MDGWRGRRSRDKTGTESPSKRAQGEPLERQGRGSPRGRGGGERETSQRLPRRYHAWACDVGS